MTTDAVRALESERYLNLETYRKDGTGVLTPVWFVTLDGKLAVMTNGNSYKVKRLRRNPKIRVAACNARGKLHGPFFPGTGAVVEDPELEARAFAALKKRYGWQWTAIAVVSRLTRRRGDWIALMLDLDAAPDAAAPHDDDDGDTPS